MPEIGKRIKAKREELGITQEELAQRLGYKSKTTIAKIENGINDIVQSKVVEFASALNTTVPYLMGWLDTAQETRPTQSEIEKFKENTYEKLVLKEMAKMNQKGKVKLLDTAREMNCNPLYNPKYKIDVAAAHERTDIEVTEEMRRHDDEIMMDDSFWE